MCCSFAPLTRDQCECDVVGVGRGGIGRFNCTNLHVKADVALKHRRSVGSTVFTAVLRAGQHVVHEIGRLREKAEVRERALRASRTERKAWMRSVLIAASGRSLTTIM